MVYGALGGANLIHLASGMLDFILTVSPEQIVIDNEILGMVLHGLKGIHVNDETLARDVIMQIGPRGQFLAQKHTLRNAQKQLYVPTISDRLSRESWEKRGQKDILSRANEKSQEILTTHTSPSLSTRRREERLAK